MFTNKVFFFFLLYLLRKQLNNYICSKKLEVVAKEVFLLLVISKNSFDKLIFFSVNKTLHNKILKRYI